MEKRVKLLCWHCDREYSLLRELVGSPRLFVECPFCGSVAVADLAPYRTEVVETMAADERPNLEVGETLDLPLVLPTAPLEEEE